MLSTLVSEIQIATPDYSQDSSRGDCRMRAFSQLTGFYGQRATEAEIWGLGSGPDLRTETIDYEGNTFPVLVTRRDRCETDALEKLGYTIKAKNYAPKDAPADKRLPFEPQILELVGQRQPVLLFCNLRRLPYVQHLHVGDNPNHMVMVTGFSLSNKTMTVLDSLTNQKHTLPMAALQEAIDDTLLEEFGTHYWLDIRPTDKVQQTKDRNRLLAESLQTMTENYLSAGGALTRLEEFIRFCLKMYDKAMQGSKTHEKYLQALTAMNCLFLRRLDDIDGTCFRTLYRNYLEGQTDSLLPVHRLTEKLQDTEEKWRLLTFKLRYDRKTDLTRAKCFIQVLREIRESEQAVAWEMQQIQNGGRNEKQR